jgi:hypothetical protein
VSRELAASAMKYYDGNKPGGTPGMIASIGDFNWWEAGALFGQVRIFQVSFFKVSAN